MASLDSRQDRFVGLILDERYHVRELVGVGGMANVYKAFDSATAQTVAVKVLREEYAQNDEFLRRFKNESRAIAVLSHPNIVKVLDVSFSEDVNYIVMEYIDGITLKEYIEEQHALAWKDAVFFAVQILRALQHAHDKGIVHRDVKPQNIMLLADGSIKVTDFGIARFARSGMRTITDRAIGSVHYISPEQARGETTDHKADIYSVGVMLFEMLTGELPFEAESPVSVALKQIQEEVKRPTALNPSIPLGLEEVTLRAMEKDPRRRYQSAAEMLRDLEELRRSAETRFGYPYPQAAKAGERGEKKTGNGQRGASSRRSKGRTQEEDNVQQKKLPIIPILAGIAAAFVVGTILFIAVMFSINNPFGKVEDITVPTLVGQKYETVRTAESYQNLTIELEESVYSDEFEKGVIIDQKPNAGRSVKVGSKVTVTVSLGTEIVTLPDFMKAEATSVFAKLKDLGLEYQQVDVFNDNVESGYVVSTDPGKGSQVPAGTTVRVFVSMGPDTKVVPVPDVGGKTLDEAKAAIAAAGLEVGTIEYKDSESESGLVIGQNPGPTSQVAEGGYVNLTISSGDQVINSVQIYVKLPEEISSVITVKAVQDGNTVIERQMQPSLVRIWKPSFSGEGNSTVQIYIDNALFQEYVVDFENKQSTLITDNTGSME